MSLAVTLDNNKNRHAANGYHPWIGRSGLFLATVAAQATLTAAFSLTMFSTVRKIPLPDLALYSTIGVLAIDTTVLLPPALALLRTR